MQLGFVLSFTESNNLSNGNRLQARKYSLTYPKYLHVVAWNIINLNSIFEYGNPKSHTKNKKEKENCKYNFYFNISIKFSTHAVQVCCINAVQSWMHPQLNEVIKLIVWKMFARKLYDWKTFFLFENHFVNNFLICSFWIGMWLSNLLGRFLLYFALKNVFCSDFCCKKSF